MEGSNSTDLKAACSPPYPFSYPFFNKRQTYEYERAPSPPFRPLVVQRFRNNLQPPWGVDSLREITLKIMNIQIRKDPNWTPQKNTSLHQRKSVRLVLTMIALNTHYGDTRHQRNTSVEDTQVFLKSRDVQAMMCSWVTSIWRRGLSLRSRERERAREGDTWWFNRKQSFYNSLCRRGEGWGASSTPPHLLFPVNSAASGGSHAP